MKKAITKIMELTDSEFKSRNRDFYFKEALDAVGCALILAVAVFVMVMI